ncbi:TetR/AcrR family transcriptional regulator [Sphingopyxis sp.]|jgi:AcrR family transcriptional regulator|uniref:TetR/AcrR family transcriptional regulator n=1 Tax=Sphingopyxis sp. TaxID=1908224 RepID=UPI002DF00191|nr:TetR/AcrR family transcriptional regulator [Sphingopyxis sp.]
MSGSKREVETDEGRYPAIDRYHAAAPAAMSRGGSFITALVVVLPSPKFNGYSKSMKATLKPLTTAAPDAPNKGKPKPARGRGRPVGDRTAQRAKLLKAVMAVIAQEGYIGASLRKVATYAGFTTGAVSYYFDNKEAMIVAAAEHLFDEFDAMLRAMRRSADLREGMERWLTWMSDTELWLANVQLIAFAAQEPRCAEVIARRYARYRENYTIIIRAWQKSGSVRDDLPAEILTDQLCAITDGWMLLLPIEAERFSPQNLRKMTDGLINLVAAPPP